MSRPVVLPTEEQEQIALFSWARRLSAYIPELAIMYHIPNGGSRRPREGVYLRASGVLSGVPDICLPVPRGGYGALYIELKRVKRGVLSRNQKAMIEALNDAGNLAIVCKGAAEAEARILEYLGREAPT